MNDVRPVPIAAAAILALSLVIGSVGDVNAAQGSDPCVAVSGGTVSNATNLAVTADGGVGIADASGGSGNLAVSADRGNRDRDGLGQDIASAGNAGVATASANGGVVSIGDINSGGNVGNAIAVGDTVCPAAPIKAAPIAAPKAPVKLVTVGADRGSRGGRVRALPSTGVGAVEVGTSGSLVLALGALGLMALSLGNQYDRRVFRAGRR